MIQTQGFKIETRGFKVARGFEDKDINLPERQTKAAAGYDFESAKTVKIPSIWKILASRLLVSLSFGTIGSGRNTGTEIKMVIDEHEYEQTESTIIGYGGISTTTQNIDKKTFKPTLVPTGIKAYMQDDEYLQLVNRSSNPMKNFLLMSNGVGVIDADYYENEDNDGHIMFQFINFGLKDKNIKKGDRIGQGIFLSFLKSDQEINSNKPIKERVGGFGSTSKEEVDV